jgi:hypothetical protein
MSGKHALLPLRNFCQMICVELTKFRFLVIDLKFPELLGIWRHTQHFGDGPRYDDCVDPREMQCSFWLHRNIKSWTDEAIPRLRYMYTSWPGWVFIQPSIAQKLVSGEDFAGFSGYQELFSQSRSSISSVWELSPTCHMHWLVNIRKPGIGHLPLSTSNQGLIDVCGWRGYYALVCVFWQSIP